MLTNEKPEIAFFNGKIVTLDASDMIATAVAIRNGRVVEVYKERGHILNIKY
jgi:predicted amidohydrolase YtcJ